MAARLFVSSANAERIDFAVDFLRSAATSGAEILLVAPTRRAADDVARIAAIGAAAGLLGVHRTTLPQLAAELAHEELALRGIAPLSPLAAEAVAARAIHGCIADGGLEYFAPVAATPGFARALARTIAELRLEGLEPPALLAAGRQGRDISRLLLRYNAELERGRFADLARTLALATGAAEGRGHRYIGLPLLLLDVSPASREERRLVAALAVSATQVAASAIEGDGRGIAALEAALRTAHPERPPARVADRALERVRARVFSVDPGPPSPPDDSFDLFSAPNEGRECIEIARRILAEAAAGTPFDRIAVLLRSPDAYQPLLEDALRRAGAGAFYTRGSARPNPAGRAFLALLACASEGLSATRFAEYLSLGQVPPVDDTGAPPAREVAWVASADDAQLGFRSNETPSAAPDPLDGDEDDDAAEPPAAASAPVIAGGLRVPRHWERMLVDASVIGGRDRWARRLRGLAEEWELHLALLTREGSPRAEHVRRDLARLHNLERFALPLIDRLAILPEGGTWGDWIHALEALAVRALERPNPVRRVLAELRPMREIGPVSLSEARAVLSDRLTFLRYEVEGRRYGRVFVGTIEEAAGRSFDVVFLPGLADGVFPRKAFEDPLLLDELRAAIDPDLAAREQRFARERSLLRLAAGAATKRLAGSFPRTDMAEGRPRVPSFYALDLARAAEGNIPSLRAFEHRAMQATDDRLGWPAPKSSAAAIDDAEHDLAQLSAAIAASPGGLTGGHGHAAYLLQANANLARALRARGRRWRGRWFSADGIVDPGPEVRAILETQRLRARSYSPTALQNFAECPYRFFLQAILRLRPRPEAAAIEQMDPLVRGSLFHEVQFLLLTRLQSQGSLPITAGSLDAALSQASAVLEEVDCRYADRLAPAIPRVWRQGIDAIRTDLRVWLRRMVEKESDWIPERMEYGFGLSEDDQAERHPTSSKTPAAILDGFLVRGSIDLLERSASTGLHRATDYKTGRPPRTEPHSTGGGRHLQPLVYALAAERILGVEVKSGRLYYCTDRGGYRSIEIPLDDEGRRRTKQVFDTIDGALARAFLPAAPDRDACTYCDYRIVCGPNEEARTSKKPKIDALAELRKIP